MIFRNWFFVFGILFSVSLFSQQALPEDFDQWIESGRQDWKIPGMAVGIVKDGEVVFAKGFGERRLGSGERVDANTVFSIASTSKNMTAAALGILADRGKINWDDPVIRHIPWFQLKDPWVTREVTIRDALTHRVGLGRILGNRLQFMTKSSRDEVLYQMRFMDFEKPFRSSYVYNNVMYSLAGQIIEYADGRSWDDFMREEFFIPMRMDRATTTVSAMAKQSNIAFPHQEIDGRIIEIQRRSWDNAGPAAGVNASVNDLNKWLLMQLGTPGSFEGRVLVSEKEMNEIRKPQVVSGQRNAGDPQATYGFGWSISDYEGRRILNHGGATDGFNTAMYLMPELDLGIVVVGNTFNNFGTAVAYQVMDAFLGKSGRDWNRFYLENYNRYYQHTLELREKIHKERVKNTRPALSPDGYTGIYFSEAYGKAEVKKEGKQLILQLWDDEEVEAVLEHWHYETFRAVWKNRAMREEFAIFHFDKQGAAEALEIEFVLRPMLLQVGAYPSGYTQTARFEKQKTE